MIKEFIESLKLKDIVFFVLFIVLFYMVLKKNKKEGFAGQISDANLQAIKNLGDLAGSLRSGTNFTFPHNFTIEGNLNVNGTITNTDLDSKIRVVDKRAQDAISASSTANDLAQSTDFIQFEKCGNDNDQCLSGILKLYNPSSTTFVKHFLGVSSNAHEYPAALRANIGGYFNTTSAINAVQFKFDSGEIQGGTIDLFGVV